MPPSSATAPAEPALPARTGPSTPTVRLTGAGGTNPHRWPLHVPRQPGEALHGWLWRLAYRYGLTPRTTLRLLGCPVRPQRAVDLAEVLLQAGPERIADELGLPPQQLDPESIHQALETARTDYLTRFHDAARTGTGRGSRYCPQCLTEDKMWQATWASPLHALCLRHRTLLANTCPTCQATPFEHPMWLTSTGVPWVCPGFYDPLKTFDSGGDATRYRGRCHADLRDVEVVGAVDQSMVAAQEYVLRLAATISRDNRDPQRCGGLTVPARVALEAILDLIHAQLGAGSHLTSPTAWAGRTARALTNAVTVVQQTTATELHATALRLGLLRPQDPQTPLGPTHLIRARPHNRALETNTLIAMRDRMSIDSDLRFRLGSALPCYPRQQRHPRDTGHLHRAQDLPELPMSSIPTLIWAEQLRRIPQLEGTADPVTVRTAAAVALAKTASSRPWNLIAVDLGLPARLSDPIRRHWRALHDDPGTWRTYLTWIDDLFVRLHDNQPPINYQARRALAGDATVLIGCTDVVLRDSWNQAPAHLGATALARLAWPLLVGSDSRLAPARLIPPDPKAARALRTLKATTEVRPLLEMILSALASLDPTAGAGPLTWQPP